jgi:[pyruvate, water dikinase]-phosphate phosphotransferase / [pyruvate, water dikinase] kinase
MLEIHIVSDSTGDTAARVARAAQSQFGDSEIELHRHARVKTREQLARAMEAAAGRRAAIFYTLVDPGLREAVIEISREHRLVALDVLGPALNAITTASGMQAMQVPGLQAPLDAQYFRRIAAIEFAVKHDDGTGSGLHEADVVLVGVSRTSKTPLSIYLGYLGYRTANVPLVKGIEPPAGLWSVDPSKVVGLTIDAGRLAEIRGERIRWMRGDRSYASLAEIYDELEYAAKVHRKLKCPVIEVSELSIEEIALRIVRVVEERRREAAPA